MINIKGLNKSFDNAGSPIKALVDIELTIDQAEVICIVGESGCGKSTLLKTIAGLVIPDSGSLSFKGRSVVTEDWPLIRQNIGYVIQDGGLFPHIKAGDNVALAATAFGWSVPRRTERIAQLAELVRLNPDLLELYPQQLSGGQRQRVALMRALMLDPDVLLLDEPLGALDPIIRHELQDELKNLFTTLGKTVVMVTHDLVEAAHLSHNLLVMYQGKICQQGRFADLLNYPEHDYVKQLIGAIRLLPEYIQ